MDRSSSVKLEGYSVLVEVIDPHEERRAMNSSVRTVLLVMLLSLATATTEAQTIEVPNIEYANNLCELRNENRVFVHAPLNTREQIVKELREHSNLLIAERPEEGDYFLMFAYTPVAEGLGTMGEAAGAAGYAELTAVKFVRYRKDQVRPRILFYWQGKKTSRSVPIPFNGLSSNGFSRPRSTRSAVEE